MNKHDITLAVAKVLSSRADSVKAVETTFETIREALNRSEKVVISNFGTFRVKARAQRQGRNPKTGQSVTVPPRKSVRFKASKNLIE